MHGPEFRIIRFVNSKYHNMANPEPELTTKGIAATNLTQVPQMTAAPAYPPELELFKDHILAVLAKGSAPPSSGPRIPPRATKHDLAQPLSKNRMYAECYGANRDKDLNLCLWVFNSKAKCPDGWSCGSRHAPLDEEELEWIRTNLLPHARGGNPAWHPFLVDLWLNYITPAAPERSRFDLRQGIQVGVSRHRCMGEESLC